MRPTKPVRRNGRFRVQTSRFALAGDRLEQVLSGLGGGFQVSKEQRQVQTAWLPSSEHGALPSSPILTDFPEETGDVSLGPWKTPVLMLTSAQVIAVLNAVLDRTTCGPGVVVGKTLTYWSRVLRFAAALVARQQYLPGVRVHADERGSVAQWEPILIGPDRLEAERLSRSMPHACRALCCDETGPPETQGSAVLAQALASLVDQLVRTGAPRADKGSLPRGSLHDRWIHALHSESGRMTGDPEELALFAEEVRQ
jgi:hypothetical protein